MKRKFNLTAGAILLSSALLFNSCIGSFGLFNKVLGWNKTVGDKWVNELVFIALCIVPVYQIAGIIDALVINSIEFWTGSNPTADVKVQSVESENGKFTITSDANGHKIEKEGSDDVVEFLFNEEENSWSVDAMGVNSPLLQFVNDQEALVYLQDGSTMTVSLDQAGVFALQQVVENKAYFASK